MSGITAACTAGGCASPGTRFVAGGHTEATLGLGVDMRENPVGSYNYLQGEPFARRILTPMTVDVP